VEKDGVKFLTGVARRRRCRHGDVPSGRSSSSTINGAGSLTTKSFHRYFFRVNTSGPGRAGDQPHLAESPRLFALGADYAWGAPA
jgi:hypothetical protein